jgi:hypothetical protein
MGIQVQVYEWLWILGMASMRSNQVQVVGRGSSKSRIPALTLTRERTRVPLYAPPKSPDGFDERHHTMLRAAGSMGNENPTDVIL